MFGKAIVRSLLAVAMVVCCAVVAQAVTIDPVPVGNPGNAGDTRYETPGYGAVGYEYQIGKYEVTAGQYTDFLNAVAADVGLWPVRVLASGTLGLGRGTMRRLSAKNAANKFAG